MKDVLVIKLGGMLLNSDIAINNFFKILHDYKPLNYNILIVHGGEYWAKDIYYHSSFKSIKNRLLNIDYENNINNDFKISIFSGIINTNIVKHANKNNVNVIGLHCTDGDTLILNSTNINDSIYSGSNSLKLIHYLFSCNIIPIISPTCITKNNDLINVDADIISMLLTKAFKAKLIFLTDVSGVLDGKGQIIKKINFELYRKLVFNGIISSGMHVKVSTAMKISKDLNQKVSISGFVDHMQLKNFFSGELIGTTIINTNKDILRDKY